MVPKVSQKKKKIAFLLALVLLLSVLILPAYAATESLESHICPACGGTAYVEWDETIRDPYDVYSCDVYPASHTHTTIAFRIYTQCDDCGNVWVTYNYSIDDCPYE